MTAATTFQLVEPVFSSLQPDSRETSNTLNENVDSLGNSFVGTQMIKLIVASIGAQLNPSSTANI